MTWSASASKAEPRAPLTGWIPVSSSISHSNVVLAWPQHGSPPCEPHESPPDASGWRDHPPLGWAQPWLRTLPSPSIIAPMCNSSSAGHSGCSSMQLLHEALEGRPGRTPRSGKNGAFDCCTLHVLHVSDTHSVVTALFNPLTISTQYSLDSAFKNQDHW